MLPAPTIFLISIVGLVLLSVVSLISIGVLPTLVLIGLIGITGGVLFKLGVLDIKSTPSGLDIGFHESAPAPAESNPIQVLKSLEQKEVFNVAGNEFTYDEAAAVCAAYDADLATYDQVNTAFSAGAEWCGYGWSQGGMALFPTQQATWELLQQESDSAKRTACGRPGVNGGYFDPQNKFGVNCYGIKPKGGAMKFPLPVPGVDTQSFNRTVDKFKSMLSQFSVSAFNRDGWSEWNIGGSSTSKSSGPDTELKMGQTAAQSMRHALQKYGEH